jgi:Holliday junction resolvase-like predicted endonuclease
MTHQIAFDWQWHADMLANRKAKSVGLYGEGLALLALRRAGYIVSQAHVGERRGDLIIIDSKTGEITTRIEVKTARLSKDGRYHFCLRRQLPDRLCTSADHADVLLLLACEAHSISAYVIPTALIPGLTCIAMTSRYGGKYAQFRQAIHDLTLPNVKNV